MIIHKFGLSDGFLGHRCIGILLLLVVSLLPGCGDDLEVKDAVGTFQSNHGHGVEVLDLNPDGTYVLTYRRDGAIIFTNSNRWTFERNKDGVAMITFYQFRFGYRDSSFSNRPALVGLEIERSFWGVPEMIVDPDLYFGYVKQ
ncbi:hypothetical protein [Allorhizobium taibaishanense]|uniref:Uncharacterized protein n=1 Tax=Allorhizobium taibaishanense TaxID=887144 RepID=A0A1Q8ZZK0_9HYPH|nr:hypothetical protein [Allorhizobium taibaishanense]MBB4007293.1 hypothetical protein [Allorhizobium taibaishanense]OLP47717.1 hypothetical protein BJF91_04885 [Allorhizobium taibaishanense]